MRRFTLVGLMVLAGSVPARARAQNARIPIPYRTYVAVNPLGIPFDIASGEIETAVASGITIGGTASYTVLSHDRYTTFEGKVRYYPSEVVLQGLSLGVSVGHSRYSTLVGSPTGDVRTAIDYNTLGLIVDYNALLGARKRFVVGTGLGAKRVLGSEDDRNRVDLGNPIVTVRFVVGLAF